ncbi:MAG: nicotinamide-nucleotide amidohydrolase family protein [Bacteroidia bacterium]
MYKAALLTVGDELTEGYTLDTNTFYLARRLTEIGLRVGEAVTLPDDAELLQTTLKRLWEKYNLTFITGGLGNTQDDITKRVLATWHNETLVLHQPTWAKIQAFFSARGREATLTDQGYAQVPNGFEVLPNPVGLAPGLWKNTHEKVLIALPGVPKEVEAIFENLVERLRAFFRPTAIQQHVLHVALRESILSQKIEAWEKTYAGKIFLAYNPHTRGVTLRLRAQEVEPAFFTDAVEQLRALVKPYLYAEGEKTLPEAIFALLEARQWKLAIAESCTGGHLAAQFVEIPGISAVWQGAIIAYHNAIKQNLLGVSAESLAQEGAVSQTVAHQMAQGAKKFLGAEVGVATTGIAGPQGGSEKKPVGTVWISVHTPEKQIAQKYLFPEGRKHFIRRTVDTALLLLWQNLRL